MSSLPNANINPIETAGNWNEPKTSYGKVKGKSIKKGKNKSSLYPFNKVYESESGHIFEMDDTPGSERLHLFHRSGSFHEIHPNGDSVTKVVRDNYTSILRDNYVHIDGHCNVTIDKALKILVNADKTQNTPSKTTNFDIEIGENANINILVNKGNCQLRLKNGDANVLVDRGDVNIRQEAGNYNHFVNGDYNLEVAGHMHVVVGEDHVTEIGGSRDVRVDGIFDNLFVTSGYSETTIPNGNLKYTIGVNKEEFIGNEYHQKVIGLKLTEVGGNEEKRVTGEYLLQSNVIGIWGYEKVGMGNSNAGFDMDVEGNWTFVSPTEISFTSNKYNLTTLDLIDLYSANNIRLTGEARTNISSSTQLNISSNGFLNLLSDTSIFQTAQQIHLNGPSAQAAENATVGPNGLVPVRTNAPLPPVTPYVYIPGSIGTWRRTINGTTPLTLVKTSVETLKLQLAALDAAANTTEGLKAQTGGLVSSFSELSKTLSSSTPSVLTNTTTAMSNIANGANQVAQNVTNITDTTMTTVQGVTDTMSSVTNQLTEPLSAVIKDDGPLGVIKGALSSVTGFISDIVNTIADIACSIVDAIGSLIDSLAKKIQEAINAVMSAIGTVLDTIGKIIDSITKIISEIISKITDLIGSILDAAGKFIDGVISEILGIFDGIGGRPSNCGLSIGLNINGTGVGLATGPGGTGVGVTS
jgi:hypothetical protein